MDQAHVNQVKIYSLLAKLSALCPEWRIGQLVSNAAYASGWDNKDIFHVSDVQLIEGLEELIRTYSKES